MAVCAKRCYPSRSAARLHTQATSNKLRVYFCHECRAYHVTHSRERRRLFRGGYRRRQPRQHDWTGELE